MTFGQLLLILLIAIVIFYLLKVSVVVIIVIIVLCIIFWVVQKLWSMMQSGQLSHFEPYRNLSHQVDMIPLTHLTNHTAYYIPTPKRFNEYMVNAAVPVSNPAVPVSNPWGPVSAYCVQQKLMENMDLGQATNQCVRPV